MKNLYIITVFLLLVFATNLFSHNPEDHQLPLPEYQLKNKRHLHGSFLFMRHDSVFLEMEKGGVKALALSDFSITDQQRLKNKAQTITQINHRTPPQQHARSIEQPSLFHSFSAAWWLCLPLCLSFLVLLFFLKNGRQKAMALLSAGILLAGLATATGNKLFDTDPLVMDTAFEPFKPHIATHWDDTWFYVESNGIPQTHSMMTGIVKWQQQVPIPQCYTGDNAWQIPLHPVLAAQPVPVNDQHFLRGAVAIAANGIPIFNPHTNTGVDALADGQLDQWGGHSGRADDYHYHIAPLFLDTQSVDILPIAFGLDGFAVYAGLEPDGAPMLPLDDNHGHFDATGTYHYHGTPEAPYMIGNMVGQVTEDATMQIIPQAHAMPVRPSLTPLTGATITGFVPQAAGNGYILTYVRNGQTFQLDYSWTPTGVYTYHFISPSGTTTETYNGQMPCALTTAVQNLLDQQISVSLFPNPAQDRFELNISSDISVQAINIQLIDLNGRVIFSKNKPDNVVELGEIARGIYLVKINFQFGDVYRKIIIQ
ncbi:MAG: YHYH protein [Saprospiraceae bacterium]|nr:YHYH protein [Saprospiraceae bacterium]